MKIKYCIFILLLASKNLFAQDVSLSTNSLIGTACPCNDSISHVQYVECVTKTTAVLVKNKQMSPRQAAAVIVNAVKSECGKSPEDSTGEGDSPGILSLTGVSESGFNPSIKKITFNLTDASFSDNPEHFSVHLNGSPITPSDLTITSSSLAFTIAFTDGLNDLSLYALDNQMRSVEGHYNLWAGSNSLTVAVTDQNNNTVNNATVKIALSDDSTVTVSGITQNGTITFSDLPGRTLIATATATGNLFGSAATVGGEGFLTVKLNAFNAPSNIDNNDISLGTAGWAIGTAPVTVIQHQEGIPTFKNPDKNIVAENMDLSLSTSGEGEQQMSRTFQIKPGTKNVKLRYRFITTEVPGGYFGSQFNDYFSVSVRSKNEGGIRSEQNSMNGLGLEAFDFNSGATAWKEISLPVSMQGDIVQVDVAVANVADGLFDSYVVVDFINEGNLSIAAASLIDPDKVHTITYLSIDNHSYFNGTVPVYGKITIKGAADDKLTALNLEVLKDGNVISSTSLTAAVQSQLFQTFGSDEKVEITSTTLLFEIPASSPLASDGKVLLRLSAETEDGESTSKDYGSVPNLRLYTGTNRYGGRDADKGGDDWALPSTVAYTGTLNSAWTFGDFSNMNGNVFSPHATHRDGIDMDVWFTGYNNRDATVANTLIDFLNSSLGSGVDAIYVTYTTNSSDVFYNAIKNVTLNNGYKATDIIRPVTGHTTHFHIKLKVNATSTFAPIKKMLRKGRFAANKSKKVTSNNVLLYPNPSKGIMTLSLKTINDQSAINLKEIRRIVIYNKSGNVEKLINYAQGTKSVNLNLPQLRSDNYTIEVTDGVNTATLKAVILK